MDLAISMEATGRLRHPRKKYDGSRLHALEQNDLWCSLLPPEGQNERERDGFYGPGKGEALCVDVAVVLVAVV